jgi:hypothetical protein
MTKNKVDQDAKKLREAVSNERKEESTASNGKKEKIDVIAKLGRRYFSTPEGIGFYYSKKKIPIEINSSEFEGLISKIKYKADGRPATGEEILSVKRLASYYASRKVREIGVRSARVRDTIIYDPVRKDGKVYFITKDGVKLRRPDKPYTVRYTGMLEAAVENGTIEDHLALIRLWSLDSDSEFLSIGLDFCRFIPGISQAIETLDGPHGSGKTSDTETHRSIFDPNAAPTQSLKFDERDISISALHQGMIAFDNVNAAMPDYISDLLCRLTTGQGFRTRELYTNTGEVILKLKRSIIINGINRVSYRPDFIDRECPIHLGVMPESRRLTDAEIKERAEVLIPKVRGFILSIIPKAMQLYPEVESELKGKLPRMADFVIWAECGIRAMGFPAMSFYNAYTEAKHDETVDVARGTLLIEAIQGLMASREEWTGTTKDLLNTLETFVTENQRKSRAFPRDERRLGRALRELIPTLKEIGYEITDLKNSSHEKKISKIGDTYKVNSTNSTNQIELTKNAFSMSAINKNPKIEKKLIAPKAEPEFNDVQSKNAISAINYNEQGEANGSKNDGGTSEVQVQETKQYFYRVVKDFFMDGRRYSAGYTFATNSYLENKIQSSYLELIDRNDLQAKTNDSIKKESGIEASNDGMANENVDERLKGLSEMEKAVFKYVHEYQDDPNKQPLHRVSAKDVLDALSISYPDFANIHNAFETLEKLCDIGLLEHSGSKFLYREVSQ